MPIPTLIKFATLPRYPNLNPKLTINPFTDNDLVKPFVIRNQEIVPEHRERFESLCRTAETSTVLYGIDGGDSIFAVYWDELTTDEQQSL